MGIYPVDNKTTSQFWRRVGMGAQATCGAYHNDMGPIGHWEVFKLCRVAISLTV